LFLDKSPEEESTKDAFGIHVKENKNNWKQIKLVSGTLESYEYVYACPERVTALLHGARRRQNINTIIRILKPFIDGNIVVLYTYVIKFHQNKGGIW
jgi:hypothetical protein